MAALTPAAEPRDGRDRRDAGDRAPPPAARGLRRPRAARGAHDRGRPRGRARREPARPFHRAAARCRLPRLDLHRRRPPADRGGAPHRRAGDRAAHRRLLRGRPRRRRRRSATRELARLREMAAFAHDLGLEVHAGHGLTFDNVGPVAALPEVRELNIGHFLSARRSSSASRRRSGGCARRWTTPGARPSRRRRDAARRPRLAPGCRRAAASGLRRRLARLAGGRGCGLDARPPECAPRRPPCGPASPRLARR